MATLNTIKNWFKTGLKPTQNQFWDTWDSFFHKDEIIPASSIENLDARFDEKADAETLDIIITKLNPPIIDVAGDMVISWQTDIVPTTAKTYAQIFGDQILDVIAVYEDAGATISYKPNWSYTKAGALINQFTITQIFVGKLTFK